MVGSIKLLQYQTLAYWRKSFSKRGSYDRFSFVLVLIILLAGFRFVLLLNQTAKSLSEGKTGDLNLLLVITFFAWLIPAFESQKATKKLDDFIFLPISQNQFSLISLANIFLVPTSIIALIVSLSIIYPLAFSQNFVINFVSLFFYSLFSAFLFTIFVRLLKLKFFRVFLFLTVIFLAVFGRNFEFNLQLLPHNLLFSKFLLLLAFTAFFLAFITIRLTISAKSNRQITPQWLSKVRLPLKFGEMIKKDFFASWKILDCYISLLISIVYVIILISADVSFFSFSLAISFSIMMCGSLAFNIFGLENLASFQRLSLLPIEPQDLFIAKNKVFGLLIFSTTFFLFPLIFYKFGLIFFLVAILKTVAISLFYLTFGNNLSIRFPFKMNFYEVSLGGSLQDMLTAVCLISFLSIIPDFFLMPNALAILLINIGLVVFSYFAYQFSLSRVSGKLPIEWENIALKLS